MIPILFSMVAQEVNAQPSPVEMKARRSAFLQSYRGLLAAILFLLVLNLGVFWFHWTGTVSFTYDFPLSYYASTAYWIASVEMQEWPHWIPYQSMGYPFAMNVQTGMYYPPLWLFVLLRQQYTLHAANIVQALHVLLGAVGFFLLTRTLFKRISLAVLGGAAYQLYGGFFTNAEHVDIIRAFAILPWVLWALWLDDPSARDRGLIESRLRGRNLALPLILYCYITGAYMGNVISGFAVFGIFIAVQTVRKGGRWVIRFRDAIIQYVLVGISVAMSAVFLLPVFALRSELTRWTDYAGQGQWFLQPKDFWNILFPATLFTTTDVSMLGMQFSLVIVAFIFCVRRRDLARLLPFLVVAIFSVLMSVDTFRPFSALLGRIFTPFALSRFPSGDYRTFAIIAGALLCISGASSFFEDPEPRRRSTLIARYTFAATLMALAAWWCVSRVAPAETAATLLNVAILQISTVLAAIAAILFLRSQGLLIAVLLALTVASMLPGLYKTKAYWFDPSVTRTFYENFGVPLKVNGNLRVYRIFRFEQKERPPRKEASPHNFAWEGYIDGRFMMGDAGRVTSRARATVETNEDVKKFMLEGTNPVAFDCAVVSCDAPAVEHLDLRGSTPPAGFSVIPTDYDRNDVEYKVSATRPILLVENETYAAGWTGLADGKVRLRPVRVNGALRGWVVPAGTHHLVLSYHTPLLAAGAATSGAALMAYIALLAFISRTRKRNPHDPGEIAHSPNRDL